jgi:hypothetical protein
LFLVLAVTINLAVYGWLGAMDTWSATQARVGDRLAYLLLLLLLLATFTVLAVGAWYTLTFVVLPFG